MMDYIRITKEYSGFTKVGLQTVFFIGITNNRTQDYRGITLGITKKKRRDYKKITKKSVGITIRNRIHNWLPDFQLDSTTFLPGIQVESATFFIGILESRNPSRIRNFFLESVGICTPLLSSVLKNVSCRMLMPLKSLFMKLFMIDFYMKFTYCPL